MNVFNNKVLYFEIFRFLFLWMLVNNKGKYSLINKFFNGIWMYEFGGIGGVIY